MSNSFGQGISTQQKFYPAFLPLDYLAISTTSTMHKWPQGFQINYCGSAQPFQKVVEVNSVGDRISSIRAVPVVGSHSNWGQPDNCWSWPWFLQQAYGNSSQAQLFPSAPSRRGQGHNWCQRVTKCLMVLQWGTQCQVLSRQDSCCCNSLQQLRIQCRQQDCSQGLQEEWKWLSARKPQTDWDLWTPNACSLIHGYSSYCFLLLCKCRMRDFSGLFYFWDVRR